MPRARGSVADAHIGAQLRSLRRAHNISQSNLGAALRITYQQVQKYETGKDRMSVAMLLRAMQVFGVPVEYFLAGLSEPAKDARRRTRSLENADALRAFATIEDGATRRRLLALIKAFASR